MSKRPRGFATWKPNAETSLLLANVFTVLDEYRTMLPLTARQIFYRLVGQYDYDKTEQAYGNLCEKLVRARRCGLIPFTSIRDDGTAGGGGGGYNGPESFWRSVRTSAEYYSRDLMIGQTVRVELWCEAKGMLPQLQKVARDYCVPVFATGGFSSVTVTREIAVRALGFDGSTIFLHVGDYDPSGESIFNAMHEDAAAFIEDVLYDGEWAQSLGAHRIKKKASLDPRRVALTEDQVVDLNLPTAPPKKSDQRSKSWVGETCQCEAMPPDVLAETVRSAIEDSIDLDEHARQLSIEEEETAHLVEKLDDLLDGEGS